MEGQSFVEQFSLNEFVWRKGLKRKHPRIEKYRDYRSGGSRHWPSGPFGGARQYRCGAQNYIQTLMNRKARRIPVVDTEGEGIKATIRKTVDWLVH